MRSLRMRWTNSKVSGAGFTGCGKTQFLSFRGTQRAEESLILLTLRSGEIPRFARNDKRNYFFRGHFSLSALILPLVTKTDRLKPVLLSNIPCAADATLRADAESRAPVLSSPQGTGDANCEGLVAAGMRVGISGRGVCLPGAVPRISFR